MFWDLASSWVTMPPGVERIITPMSLLGRNLFSYFSIPFAFTEYLGLTALASFILPNSWTLNLPCRPSSMNYISPM